MPINTQHPDYIKFLPKWEKCRVCMEGEDAVHAAGELFLPKLTGQEQSEYESYLTRAMFFNGAARSRRALMGAIFSKDPQIIEPAEEFFDSITPRNEEIISHARWTVKQILTTGRVGLLLDFPVGETAITTPAYLAAYEAEDIINWRSQLIDGEDVLTLVVLQEPKLVDKIDDSYELETEIVYRELVLVEEGETYAYEQQIWKQVRDNKGKLKQEWVKDGSPTRPGPGGRVLERIPMVLVGVETNDVSPDNPPLLDLVNVNLSHYRNSADLEHGRHFTGLPTAWVAGFPTSSDLKIGSSTAWVSPKSDAKASYLEFSGQGLGSLEKALEQKVSYMSVIGARVLDTRKGGVEHAETIRLRTKTENASLVVIADNVSTVYTHLMELRMEWMGINGELLFHLNTDFAEITITPEMLAQWQQCVMSGIISYQTFYENIKRAELVPSDRTAEEEKEIIANEGGGFGVPIGGLGTVDTVAPEFSA